MYKIYKYLLGLMRRVSSTITPPDNRTQEGQKSWCITVRPSARLFHLRLHQSTFSPTMQNVFMCTLICGCSWKARSLGGRLPPRATSHCSHSCLEIPVSAVAG